ncbi:MAG TPA: hypothetical protein VNJ50_11850 [Gelidibacter sp.]|uniref:hypothetical protein n=1 Tax=Gelidibacter sp. TaxID=2018083 RepID=UPI002BA3A10A|nr:hypothetical protein [Gelidibacter sp.]HXJ99535.1 hypothetical protein [Gelidibacter sp.]
MRTRSQQEIDYVEITPDEITAYEFKWSKKTKVKIPKSFETYYNTTVTIINSSNFISFLNP